MAKSAAKVLGAGQLSLESNGYVVQTANSFVTADITGTPKTSPLTVSTAVIPLLVPLNAASATFYATTNDTRISEDDAAGTYFVLKAGGFITVPCARQANIYVVRDGSSDATLQFLFNLL